MRPIGKLAEIPVDVLDRGLDAISEFLADVPLRGHAKQNTAKLLVVGFAEVGKTTLLRALFPEKAEVTHMGISKTLCLQGLRLTLEWNALWGIWQLQGWLNPTFTLDAELSLSLQGKSMWIGDTNVTFSTEQEAKRWHDMLREIVETCAAEAVNAADANAAAANATAVVKKPLPHRTHGIDIRTQYIDGVQVSAWNFAGQRAYLGNNRHFVGSQASFLHDQSVYMVVYDASKRHEDIRMYLMYWLRTLKAHLPKAEDLEEEVKRRTFIYVVGTHLDAEGVSVGIELAFREKEVRKCIEMSMLGYDWEHFEMSASTLDAVRFDHSEATDKKPAKLTRCFVSDLVKNLNDRLLAVSDVPVLMSKEHAAVLEAIEDCKDPMVSLKELYGMLFLIRCFFAYSHYRSVFSS